MPRTVPPLPPGLGSQSEPCASQRNCTPPLEGGPPTHCQTAENHRGSLPRAHVPPPHFLSAHPGLTAHVPLRSPLSHLFPPSRTCQQLPPLASAWPGLSPSCFLTQLQSHLLPCPSAVCHDPHPTPGHSSHTGPQAGPGHWYPRWLLQQGQGLAQRRYSRLMEGGGGCMMGANHRSPVLPPRAGQLLQEAEGLFLGILSQPASSFPGSVAQEKPHRQ